jgi:hypothetical protein
MVELNPTPPEPPLEPRPDLRLVSPDTEPEATTPEAIEPPETQPEFDDDPLEEPDETTNDQMASLRPLAPLDQRMIAHATQIWQAAPRWSQRPPSLAEIWDYSTSGDWTAEEKSLKRTLHALVVVITFTALYPVSWVVQVALHKPIGFVITLAILLVIGQIVF